jgi:HEAT repeat protein
MNDHLNDLFAHLHGSDGMARKRSRETLVLAGEAAVPGLHALLGDPDKQVRWEAAKALAAVRDPGSLDVLLKVLDDPDSDLRWLATTGLIDLGPRVVRPVLQSLGHPEVTRGRLQMSHRILAELAKENDVLAGIVRPLLEMMSRDDRGVTAATAARALSDFDQATGRPPQPRDTPPTDD